MTARKAFHLAECTRCHQTREKIYKVKATGATGFSHSSHLAKSPDCGVCHPALFAAGPNKRFTMADMKKGNRAAPVTTAKKPLALIHASHAIRLRR